MRKINLVPRPVRKFAKTFVPRSYRKWMHRVDYQTEQIVKTYHHHLWLRDESSWKTRFGLIFTLGKRFNHRPCVLSYPSLPDPSSVIYKVLLHLGFRVTGDPNLPCDVAMRFNWGTFGEIDDTMRALSEDSTVVNVGATDISKSTVSATFEEVFTYPLHVDPTSYEGPILRKSDLNATHDGTVMDGPITTTDEGFVYQRLIDNLEDNVAKDFRVMVIGREIPFVRVKYRPVDKRFDHAGQSQIRDEVRLPTEIFSDSERQRIVTLCERMGVDFGELDVLRDRKNGQIYVVDVNKTPTGPTFVSTEKETIKWCFDAMGEAFIRAFMPGHERRTLPSAY